MRFLKTTKNMSIRCDLKLTSFCVQQEKGVQETQSMFKKCLIQVRENMLNFKSVSYDNLSYIKRVT